MGREADLGPDPIDVAVGSRVRLRRKALGMSQTRLAEALNVTFQQIQKYEKGSNRISASTLVRTATALSCPVSALLGETEDGAASDPLVQLLTVPGAEDLLKAYASVNGSETRRAILTIAQALALEARSKAAVSEAA